MLIIKGLFLYWSNHVQFNVKVSFIDKKVNVILARINNFTDSGEGYIAADIVPDRIFPTPHGRAVLASAAVVRLSGVPIGVAHGLSRPLPNIGAFLGIVSCPKPNVIIDRLLEVIDQGTSKTR